MSLEPIDLPVVGTPSGEFRHPLCLLTPCEALDDIAGIVCGHSNAAPLRRALVPRPGRPDTAGNLAARTHRLAGLCARAVTGAYIALVEQLGRTRHVILVWAGNQANADFLLYTARPLDLMPRGYGHAGCERGSHIVPEAMVRAHFEASVAGLRSLLRALGRPPGLKRLVLGIQPPLYDEGLIRERLHHEPHFAARAASFGVDVATVGITAATVRRKLWFVMTEMYREAAAEAEAEFVPVPDAAFDPRGFLRPDLAAQDVTHPSLAYGDLMIEHMAQRLG